MGSSHSGPVKKGPTVKGETTMYFNGLLHRIVNMQTGEWAFYNNSPDYHFRVTYLFSFDCSFQPGKNASATPQDDGLLCMVTIDPYDTQVLATGNINTYEAKYEALPLSEEYFSLHPQVNEQKYMRRLNPPVASDF